MSLLSVVRTVAADVGLSPLPSLAATSGDREMIEMVSYANEVGDELARRVAWGELTTTATVTGDGTSAQLTVASDLSRIADGIAVTRSDGAIVRPLTRAEWNMSPVEGDPRYFLLEGNKIRLWPYLANADTVTVVYQTENWCSNGTGGFTADDDETVFPEEMLTKGLIVRWRRQKGMAYQDYEADYEAALAQVAGFDDRGRL